MLHHAMRAANSVPVITFKASASGTTSATVPSSVVDGDLIVVYNTAEIVGGPTVVVPSGYTSIVQAGAGTNYRGVFSYKVATYSDAGATVTGMTQNPVMRIAVFSTKKANPTITVSAVNSQVTNSAPTNQTVSASTGTAPLVVLAGNRREGTTINIVMSPTQDGSVPATLASYNLLYKIYNSSPQNVTVSQGDSGFGNILISFFLRVS
jgi:hypothetical protein